MGDLTCQGKDPPISDLSANTNLRGEVVCVCGRLLPARSLAVRTPEAPFSLLATSRRPRLPSSLTAAVLARSAREEGERKEIAPASEAAQVAEAEPPKRVAESQHGTQEAKSHEGQGGRCLAQSSGRDGNRERPRIRCFADLVVAFAKGRAGAGSP